VQSSVIETGKAGGCVPRVERHASLLLLACVARQVLCTSRRFYELTHHSDQSNPTLDRCRATATSAAHRRNAGALARAPFGETGLLERAARRGERRRQFAAVLLRYKRRLKL
jgi:hypothetical protein